MYTSSCYNYLYSLYPFISIHFQSFKNLLIVFLSEHFWKDAGLLPWRNNSNTATRGTLHYREFLTFIHFITHPGLSTQEQSSYFSSQASDETNTHLFQSVQPSTWAEWLTLCSLNRTCSCVFFFFFPNMSTAVAVMQLLCVGLCNAVGPISRFFCVCMHCIVNEQCPKQSIIIGI